MTSSARLILMFLVSIIVGIGGTYAYSMPYEQWVFLFHAISFAIKCGLPIIIIIWVFAFFLRGASTPTTQLDEIINATSVQKTMKAASVTKMNNHQFQVGLEDDGISFVITGERDGSYSIQEFDYKNESVGKPLFVMGWKGIIKPSKQISDVIEERIERRRKYGKFTNLGG